VPIVKYVSSDAKAFACRLRGDLRSAGVKNVTNKVFDCLYYDYKKEARLSTLENWPATHYTLELTAEQFMLLVPHHLYNELVGEDLQNTKLVINVRAKPRDGIFNVGEVTMDCKIH
jgi:hypothetical protein